MDRHPLILPLLYNYPWECSYVVHGNRSWTELSLCLAWVGMAAAGSAGGLRDALFRESIKPGVHMGTDQAPSEMLCLDDRLSHAIAEA